MRHRDTLREVWRVLPADRPAAPREIAKLVPRLSPSYVRQILAELDRAGLAEHDGADCRRLYWRAGGQG
jgi:Mn-dependent DtxR family transcriptional regulator